MALVHTIGHGTKTSAELIEMLQSAGVCRLVDAVASPAPADIPNSPEPLWRDL